MKARSAGKHSPFATFGPPIPTRFAELAYQRQGSHFRILDTSTGLPVGQSYRKRATLIDDLERFARDFGCKGA